MAKQIMVIQWGAYQNRTDVKHSSWFRMEHKIWFHPDWNHLSGEEIHVWTTVLAVCSFINKDRFRLDVSDLALKARVARRCVESAIEKLQNLQCVRVVDDDPNVDVTDTLRKRSTTDGRTDGDIRAGARFDFEGLYKIYPARKGDQGKKAGLKKCEKYFTSQEQFEKLKKAITNYAAHCDAEKLTGTPYVKQFKTFVHDSWEEWSNSPGQQPFVLKSVEELTDGF